MTALDPASLPASIRTPAGKALAVAASDSEGTHFLFLPALSPLEAIERVATHGLGVFLLVALAALAAAALALGPAAIRRALRRTLRAYSRRMLVIYTSLLLVPILLLNLFLVRLFAERLRREQLAAGSSAIESAQRVLGDYVLTLAPGFGMETALDDELMLWLSEVVHHEVNLYWGSTVYASSKRDLFAAGLLPQRIPGRIYERLALGSAGRSSRTNVAGGSTYLELYAALPLPGEPANRARLFVSTPLLAQQVETEAELKTLRRRAMLATTGLMLMLALVGARLTRSFTAPLMEIVRGTQRIAGGARSLGLEPSDSELATLTEAIDRMAQSIAEGRQKLLREKTLVDRVIDNITSGVVSLDSAKRVLMLNRVASRLLGAEVGEALDRTLGEREDLAAVSGFLAAAGSEPATRTVNLGGEEGEGREWTLVWVPLAAEGEPSALLVVEDVTEVLRGQRLQAWAEMARIIAHEIKNPLTPIRLSTDHMREVYRRRKGDFDEVFERCTTNILEQVQELQNISSEFSAYSRIPRIEPRPGDLSAAVAKVVSAYRSAPSDAARVELEPRSAPLTATFDANLLGRAVRNLLENALRVTPAGGRVAVRVEQRDGWAAIVVEDDGPGVEPADLPRIFDPYFSTHDAGTGLGLPIARRIVEEHGGGIEARNRPRGGLEVVIRLPLGE